VLFLLLKVRMEPLLALRSTVSGLAKGVMDLSPRAAVNTADEFGELAQDLNHFLERIGVVVHDLDRILSEVVAVGARLGALNRDLEQQVAAMREASLRLIGDGAQRSLDTQLVAARESGAFEVLEQTLAQALAELSARSQVPDAAGPALREQLARLRQSFSVVATALQHVSPPIVVAQAQSAEYQAFAQSLRDMALLEATMQKVAESGQQVLQRLSRGRRESLAT
jgi:HAMP domain-containing protein